MLQPIDQYRHISGTWQKISPHQYQQQQQQEQQFTIATYNVLYPYNGPMTEILVRSKTRYAMQIDHVLPALQADVYCFNEVTPLFLQQLQDAQWVQAGYFLSDMATSETTSANDSCSPVIGNVIMSKFAFEQVYLCKVPQLSRRPICGKWNKTVICAAHLSALAENVQRRQNEFSYLYKICTEMGKDVIIVGDLNLHAPEEKQIFEKHACIDLWTETNGDDPGYTFDASTNWLIKTMFAFVERRRMRLDRILRTSTSLWKPTNKVTIFGDTGVAWDYLFPSDHYGLVVTLTRTVVVK